ncbi:TcaA NTF2-like domain-containing protein [Miniphocaeibacter massiliensis]|uniref:TcaA NTF2-like domain-containing protein n=1 Tax=Miniphocaeibacter massiliensis TaxID=2041841 RepID=UPI000C1B9166|nr:hypothetical protein [Miniphocaeibacter massiliensis]
MANENKKENKICKILKWLIGILFTSGLVFTFNNYQTKIDKYKSEITKNETKISEYKKEITKIKINEYNEDIIENETKNKNLENLLSGDGRVNVSENSGVIHYNYTGDQKSKDRDKIEQGVEDYINAYCKAKVSGKVEDLQKGIVVDSELYKLQKDYIQDKFKDIESINIIMNIKTLDDKISEIEAFEVYNITYENGNNINIAQTADYTFEIDETDNNKWKATSMTNLKTYYEKKEVII